MAFLDNLPTFPVVEVNSLAGLRMGHVLAQYLAGSGVTLNETYTNDFLENGAILGLGSDLEIADFAIGTHTQPFLHYTEELNTYMDALKYFAVEEDADDEIYPRLIGLYVGDTFTTDRFTGTPATQAFAKAVSGKITLQTSADKDTIFASEASTLPTGDAAVRLTYLGLYNSLLYAAHA